MSPTEAERRIRELVGDEAFDVVTVAASVSIEEPTLEEDNETDEQRQIRMLTASLRAVIEAYYALAAVATQK